MARVDTLHSRPFQADPKMGIPMSSAPQVAPATAQEIARVFALQREHQWNVKATKAPERKAKLQKLKAAVEARADEIVAAVLEDTRKPEGEIPLRRSRPPLPGGRPRPVSPRAPRS